MTTNEKIEQIPATPIKIELQTQIDALWSQVIELHKAQDAAAKNPELFSEVQV